jgi:superfamily II DNA/RNA helicase
MAPEIQKLTSRFLKDPVRIEVARKNSTAETIDQRLVKVSNKPEEKRAALRQIIRNEKELKNAIIFSNRKRDVATLARSLQRHGFSAGGLHGDMDQKSRMETLDAFKTDKLMLLVASDVAARGLDIPAVSHVFNFDVPTHAEDYIHRIGRTGRAGRSGISITLASPSDGKYLDAIVKLIQKDIPLFKVDGEAPAETTEAAADGELRSQSRGRRNRGRDKRDDDAKPAREKAESKPPREQAESRPPREQTESRSPREKAESRPPREKGERRGRDERPAAKPDRKPEYTSDTPFGSDGPVPAFLLRTSGVR